MDDQQQSKLDMFIERYKSLCRETGMQFRFEPNFVATNHGTFEIRLLATVIPYIEEK